MAKMFPEKPYEIPEFSKEDIMFNALQDLPQDYYVFHSFKIVSLENNSIQESETDFVIFHPEKGILCIEAKAGKHITYKNNSWFYGNGKEMKYGSPYVQAQNNKYNFIDRFKTNNLDYIIKKCKFLHAVWFCDISKDNLTKINLPCESDIQLTLTHEALFEPEKYINEIFQKDIHNIETNLTPDDVSVILKKVLCPAFNLAASTYSDLDYKNLAYKRLLKEQINVLNYLEEQQTAIINGAAGTGKTFIALEKARRCSQNGEKVLFLCFNKMLRDNLKQNYQDDNIAFSTIDELACVICNTKTADYELLSSKLYNYIGTNEFPFKHIIIDEGQDFGRDNINEANIIEYLESIITDEKVNGTFYIFYDKNQMINSNNIPSYLQDADCKLTLYKNCRNTKDIAITSTRVLGDKYKANVYNNFSDIPKPSLYFLENQDAQINAINYLIKTMKEKYKEIVILTCSTEEKSILSKYVKNNKYNNVQFTTCRKFKGLEADAIILVDVTKKTFISEHLIFYTGSSRARLELAIVSNLTENDCKEILDILGMPKSNRNVLKLFASMFNSQAVIACQDI